MYAYYALDNISSLRAFFRVQSVQALPFYRRNR